MTRKLHIGGEISTPGWEVLNIMSGPHVDHLCDANDLSLFDDNSFSIIYASHIVEHLDYVEEIQQALTEWYRVLSPGGKIYISVPDMDTLSELYLAKDKFTIEERFEIMRILFGGHDNDYDYHMVGLNEELLTEYLKLCGFINTQKVDVFNLFQDTSVRELKGTYISLNMIAEK